LAPHHQRHTTRKPHHPTQDSSGSLPPLRALSHPSRTHGRSPFLPVSFALLTWPLAPLSSPCSHPLPFLAAPFPPFTISSLPILPVPPCKAPSRPLLVPSRVPLKAFRAVSHPHPLSSRYPSRTIAHSHHSRPLSPDSRLPPIDGSSFKDAIEVVNRPRCVSFVLVESSVLF
jgi:hypothetical protein